MIKLVDILKEIALSEKIVKIPQEVLDKTEQLYSYIKNNYENLAQSAAESTLESPYKLPKFQNYFELSDLRANKKGDQEKEQDYTVKVGVAVINNKKDVGRAYMVTTTKLLVVNLAYFGDKEDFEEDVQHELVHAIDPKSDTQIAASLAKKDASPVEDYTKYIKSPAEFDAFTAPLVTKISNNYAKLGENKKQYMQLLKNLLADMRTKSVDDIATTDKYTPLAWLFTKRPFDAENWSAVWKDYTTELEKISRWATKPTLYKRFIKRLATELS